MRFCKKCEKELTDNLFWKNQSVCIVCQKKQWRERTPEQKEAYLKRQRDRERRDIIYALLRTAQKRAKELGREFSVTRDDIELPSHCPVLGVELKKHDGKLGMDSYTLDRIDNSKGYVPGNVRVISMRANMLKGDLTIEQVRSLLAYMERQDADSTATDDSDSSAGLEEVGRNTT